MLLDDARDTDSQAVISYHSTMLCLIVLLFYICDID